MKTFNCTQLSWRLRLSLVLNLESMRLISRFTYKSKDYKRTKDTVYPVHGLAEDYIPDLLRNNMQVLQSLLTGLPIDTLWYIHTLSWSINFEKVTFLWVILLQNKVKEIIPTLPFAFTIYVGRSSGKQKYKNKLNKNTTELIFIHLKSKVKQLYNKQLFKRLLYSCSLKGNYW